MVPHLLLQFWFLSECTNNTLKELSISIGRCDINFWLSLTWELHCNNSSYCWFLPPDDMGMHNNIQHEIASKMQSFAMQTGPTRACGLRTNCSAAWCNPPGHPDIANENLVPVHFSSALVSSSVLGCHMISFQCNRHLASLISLWQKLGDTGYRLHYLMGLRNLTSQSLAAAKEGHCFTTLWDKYKRRPLF